MYLAALAYDGHFDANAQRLEEAARLIDETLDRVEIMGPRARLYLAQEKYDLAAAVARQALRQLSGDQLRAASLLLVLVEAELALWHHGVGDTPEKLPASAGRDVTSPPIRCSMTRRRR
jgi:hypothetical protein